MSNVNDKSFEIVNNCDALCDLVPFSQFKKLEKPTMECYFYFSLQLYEGVFHFLKIVQMVPNRTKRPNYEKSSGHTVYCYYRN